MPAKATKSNHFPNTSALLEAEAGGLLLELRPALAAVVSALRPPVVRAAELRRHLNLDQKLAWSIFNAATARDASTLASLLPGRRAMERFFAAAETNGVAPDTIRRARTAFAHFEESVARHAGSRDAFETMVAELGQEGAEATGTSAADLRNKRAAFRATSLLWGREARVGLGVWIMHPSAIPDLLDGVFIRGLLGLRRTRRTVPLHAVAHHWHGPGPGDPAVKPPVALDPRETGPDAIGLLRDFCSQPLPEFRALVRKDGYQRHELVSNALGPSGEVDYFIGMAFPGESAAPTSVPESELFMFKTVDLPMGVYIGDILIHRSIWDVHPPEVGVYAGTVAGGGSATEFPESDLLPVTEHAEYLGEGIDAGRTPVVPRYAEMMGYAMDRMGWKGDEFRVFRCRVEFPVLSSRIVVRLKK